MWCDASLFLGERIPNSTEHIAFAQASECIIYYITCAYLRARVCVVIADLHTTRTTHDATHNTHNTRGNTLARHPVAAALRMRHACHMMHGVQHSTTTATTATATPKTISSTLHRVVPSRARIAHYPRELHRDVCVCVCWCAFVCKSAGVQQGFAITRIIIYTRKTHTHVHATYAHLCKRICMQTYTPLAYFRAALLLFACARK